MDMVVLGIDKSILDKVILVILCMRMKVCLNLVLKGRMSILSLLSLVVERSMRVVVWQVGIVS